MAATTTGSTGSRGGARRGNAGSPGGSDSRRGRGERGERGGGRKSGGRGGGGARESLGEAGEGWTLPPAGLGEGCQLVDIGINLSHRTLTRDLEGVLSRSAAAGVSSLVLTGTSFRGSRESAEMAAEHHSAAVQMWHTAGVHPHDAKSWAKHGDPSEELTRLCSGERCVAVGECGLDFNRMFSPQEEQESCFVAQMEIASKLGKPLFLHERDAYPRFLELLRQHRPDRQTPPAVVHCFTGSKECLLAYLEEGCYIGITGWVTDPRRGRELLELVPLIPLDRLMIETDAPFLTPFNMPFARPRTNEPCLLPYVALKLAEAYQVSPQVICQRTAENARRFFGL